MEIAPERAACLLGPEVYEGNIMPDYLREIQQLVDVQLQKEAKAGAGQGHVDRETDFHIERVHQAIHALFSTLGGLSSRGPLNYRRPDRSGASHPITYTLTWRNESVTRRLDITLDPQSRRANWSITNAQGSSPAQPIDPATFDDAALARLVGYLVADSVAA
jgi:hypothetical protein